MAGGVAQLREIARRIPWLRIAAGVAAGGAALLLSFVLRLLGLGAFLPEIAVDFAVGILPGNVESVFIQAMGEGAKAFGLLVGVGCTLLAYGLGAVPYRAIEARVRSRWATLAAYTFGSACAVLLVVSPLIGGGLLASETAVGPWFGTFGVLLSSLIYAAVLDYALVDFASTHPGGFSPTRRQFVAAGLLAVGSVALAIYGLGSLAAKKGRLAFESVAALLAKELTPTDEFYVVSKNFMDPVVDPSTYELAIDGLVSTPRTYRLEDLEARLPTEAYATLECVSNEVGGDLISTALWGGLRLADLLAEAGVEPTADWVAFTCADDYTVGIPLAKAVDPRTLLALRMNVAPLNARHGAPARIVTPGLYGMFHAKWVTRITLVQGEFIGFWQQKGWTNRGAIRTTAIIATPRPDLTVAAPVTIGGIAFAGERGISRVELSTDGGTTWNPATLKLPALSGTAWVLWTFLFDPPEGGAYRVLARAYDDAGEPQEALSDPPFPNGAAGYDSTTILVSK